MQPCAIEPPLVTPCCVHPQAHFSAVTSLALSSDGWLLLSGGRDKVVVAWDLRSNSRVATVPVYEAVEGACGQGSEERQLCPIGSSELPGCVWPEHVSMGNSELPGCVWPEHVRAGSSELPG